MTHADGDHVGGMESILREIDVGRVMDNGDSSSSGPFRAYRGMIVRRAMPYRRLHRGDTLSISHEARVYVLSPEAVPGDDFPRRPRSTNEGSVVVKVTYGQTSFLLAGDAPASVEQELIGRYGGFLRADALKLGHHGSKTSSSPAFLDAVSPGTALISAGLHNSFGHPSAAVLESLREKKPAVERTDRSGAVMLDSDGTTVRKFAWREE